MAGELTRPPLEIAVAETSDWRLDLSEFAPAGGWSISYHFRGPSEVDVAGVVDDGGFTFDVLGTTFETDGGYAWEAIATKTGERCRVQSGRILVSPNLEDASSLGSQTTHNERMLVALEAALEGTATKAHRSYTIDGRSIERLSLDDLRKHRDIYARRVDAERELSAAGVTKAPRRVAMRLR